MPTSRAIPIPHEHRTQLRLLIEAAARADIDVICCTNLYKRALKTGDTIEATIAWKNRVAAMITGNTEHRLLWDCVETLMPGVSRKNSFIDYANWVIEPLRMKSQLVQSIKLEIQFIERHTDCMPGSQAHQEQYQAAG